MNFNPAVLLPLGAKIVELVKAGIDHYAAVRMMGGDVDADVVAAFLYVQVVDWNPQIKGRTILDDESRHAMTRFLAGVACNLAEDQKTEAA